MPCCVVRRLVLTDLVGRALQRFTRQRDGRAVQHQHSRPSTGAMSSLGYHAFTVPVNRRTRPGSYDARFDAVEQRRIIDVAGLIATGLSRRKQRRPSAKIGPIATHETVNWWRLSVKVSPVYWHRQLVLEPA